MSRRTLKRSVRIDGVGLHSGLLSAVSLKPCERDGYFFDFEGDVFSIEEASFRGDGRGTQLVFEGGKYRLLTPEHLLGALHGLGVDNVLICCEGPETPILDGSALLFCDAIIDAGFEDVDGDRVPLKLDVPVFVEAADGGKVIMAFPSDRFKITYVIDYPGSAIGTQMLTIEPDEGSFRESLGQCRTFCLLREVEMMKSMGLAQGGSLDTALVVDDYVIVNESGLRLDDECVRHKILDLMGDLTLLGRPLTAHIVAVKAGHAMHLALVEKISRIV